jgi:hypothetical protein
MSTSTELDPRVKGQQEAVQKSLDGLIGGVIVAVGAVVEDGFGWPEVWPVLHVILADGTKLEVAVSQDAEGNGPGHLFIGAI